MIIDGHHHIDTEYESILQSMDSLGIDKTVLIGVGVSDLSVVTITDSPIFRSNGLLKIFGTLKGKLIVNSKKFKNVILKMPRNNEVLQAIKERPDRFSGFAFINPDQDNALEEVERCFNGGMIGIKLALVQFPTDLSGQKMMNICEYAKDKNAPIFIHQGLTKSSSNMKTMLESFPKNYFIIAHAGFHCFEDAMNAARKYENVFVDTSSYAVTRQKLIKMHKIIGPEKMIFGSDVPVMSDSQKTAFDKIQNLPIAESDKEKILGENLQNILSL